MGGAPPWAPGEWTLTGDLATIESQWPFVEEILDDPGAFSRHAPEVSAWSCGEHAGHIVLASLSIAMGIEGALSDPGANVDEAPEEFTKTVFESGIFRRGIAQAPERMDPSARAPEELVQRLPRARDAWNALSGRAAELEACPARFRHFAFGYLNPGEWVRMSAMHTAHHLSIVADIEAALTAS